MNIYSVRIFVTFRLQGANSPREAEQLAWKRIEQLIKSEPLAHITAAMADPVPSGGR